MAPVLGVWLLAFVAYGPCRGTAVHNAGPGRHHVLNRVTFHGWVDAALLHERSDAERDSLFLQSNSRPSTASRSGAALSALEQTAHAGPAPGPAPAWAAPAPAGAPAPVAAAVQDIQEVVHYKEAGAGYRRGSPLYRKQQALAAQTKVSTTMKCIIGLIAQYFLVHTTLFIVQTVNNVQPTTFPRLERCLLCVAKTLYFIPMLCVLFLATRMRAVQLSRGMTEQQGLPQWWVSWAMIICSLAVCLQTVLAAVYYALLNKDPDAAKGGNVSTTERVLNLARYTVIACLYMAFMIICIGVCTMPAPVEIWGSEGGPKVSPALVCTIFLSCLYFAVHFCIGFAETLDEFLTPEGKRFGVLAPQTLILREAAAMVDIAPMLCTLFLAARLRALQLDPRDGSPQGWAQALFYISSFSVLVLLLLCVIAAFLLRKEGFFNVADPQSPSGEQRASARPSRKVKAAELLRGVFIFFLYFSAICLVASLYMQRSPVGVTPSLPTSVQCVMAMTVPYCLVYLGLWAVTTAKKLQLPYPVASRFGDFLERAAKCAIDFYPMLGILFLGALLRALQISNGRGAPQRWAQDFMYLATGAATLLAICRLDLLAIPGKLATGSTTSPRKRSSLTRGCLLFQHISLFAMHVAVLAVIVSIFTITPDSANGRGAVVSSLAVKATGVVHGSPI